MNIYNTKVKIKQTIWKRDWFPISFIYWTDLFACGLTKASSWYNRTGWLCVNHQLAYLLDQSFPCCIVVKDVNLFNQCRNFVPRISPSHTSGNRLVLNNGSTYKYNNDKRWKMESPCTSTLIYLPFGFIPPDHVAKICDKLESSFVSDLELAHRICYQYSIDRILW